MSELSSEIMSQFSTNEIVSLHKDVDLDREKGSGVLCTDPKDIDFVYEVPKCIHWIRINSYKKVCLQFPDCMLADSVEVALRLEQALNQTVYILGDTSYGSCCIDYVAAHHIDADAIIHFGSTCLTPSLDTLPYLRIYRKTHLNMEQLIKSLSDLFHNDKRIEYVTIIIDTEYFHCDFHQLLLNMPQDKCEIQKITDNPQRDNDLSRIYIYLGENERKLTNLYLQLIQNNSNLKLYSYVSKELKCVEYTFDSRLLKRHQYLIERIKDCKSIGIVIATLSIRNYSRIVDRLKRLITRNGKRYYGISVGKLNVAKLANFNQIDVFCPITCWSNEIFDNYRDYYATIVTPYDIEMALNQYHQTANGSIGFSYDFNQFLDLPIRIESISTDLSLITGRVRNDLNIDDDNMGKSSSEEIALRSDGTVSCLGDGGDFLKGRSWYGLDPQIGKTRMEIGVEEGRKGTASGYENEPSSSTR